MNTVSWFHYLLTLIIWCNESIFLVILNSLFNDSLYFPFVFTHAFIQLIFNVMNRIKIINQGWLELFIKLSYIKRVLHLQSNFIEFTLRLGCSHVNLMHIFRAPFPRNTSGWLLLSVWVFFAKEEMKKEILFMRIKFSFPYVYKIYFICAEV